MKSQPTQTNATGKTSSQFMQSSYLVAEQGLAKSMSNGMARFAWILFGPDSRVDQVF
jgi:hypothetical protein